MSLSLDEIQSLIAGYLANTLDDEQRVRLKDVVQSDETARQLYLEYMDMNASLCRYAQMQAGKDELNCDGLPEDLVAALGEFKDGSAETSLSKMVALAPLKDPIGQFTWRQMPRVAKWSVASCFGVLATLLAFFVGGWWSQSLPMDTSASPLAMVSEISLTEGSSTTLQLANVGHVTLQGPAKFQLLGPMRARLDSGRIRMRVTQESGRGFVVETPDGDITDLGTEFGVEVGKGKSSALAVFEGAVDLTIADLASNATRIERLLGGDGVLFSKTGRLDRLNSIMSGEGAKFQICGDSSPVSFDNPLIVDVYDNLPSQSTKRYYEIITAGMKEDAIAFVDRLEHNWNGMTKASGIPKYLLEGDYIKTFNDDKSRDFKLTVVLSRPAHLYVLYDKRLTTPDWLKEGFVLTSDSIGLDTGRVHSNDRSKKPTHVSGNGPGESIDHEFQVWKKTVKSGRQIVLGENGINEQSPVHATMYGIVAEEYNQRHKKKAVVKGEALSKMNNSKR